MPAKEERKFVDREKDLIIKLAILDPETLDVVKVVAEKLDTPEKLEKFTNSLRIMSILFWDQ